MESTVENSPDFECAKIFLSLESFASKGKIKVQCSFCEENYDGFQYYINHLLLEHYPQIDLENYQDIKEEKNVEINEDKVQDSTDDFVEFLQMDMKKNSEIFFDLQKLTETRVESQTENIFLGMCDELLTSNEKLKFNQYKKCKYCDRKFLLKCTLNMHLEEHETNKSQTISGGRKVSSHVAKRRFDLAQGLSSIKRKNNASVQQTESKTTNKEEMQSSIVSDNCTPLQYQDLKNPNLEFQKFHCEICNKTFCLQSRFNSHMNRHKPCEFICEICLKEFKTAGELRTHTRFHTGERPYLCSSCGVKFATISKLINHTRRHHTFERTKECPLCKKKFFGSGELKVHLQATHSDERPYKCNLCPSTFNRQFSLRTHMKSHENKREYKCNLCSARFNQKCNLTAHKKKTHCLLMDDENGT